MPRPKHAEHESEEEEEEPVLETDSEVDEFDEVRAVAQYQPDDWDEDEDEDDSDEESADQEQALQGHLANVPLATLAKARKQVSMDDKGESSSKAAKVSEVRQRLSEMKKNKDLPGRSSKHAPTVMSTKRQVSRIRQVVDLPKNERRDPRFSSVSAGTIDPNLHQKSYSFLPQLLKEEFSQLKQDLAAAQKAERTCAWKDKEYWTGERERLERSLAQTRTRLDRHERETRERVVLGQAKKEERQKRLGGKKAWHLKKSAQKDLLLKSKFDALEASGGKMAVKKAMDKRRKKDAGKEKKSRPTGPRRSER